MTKDTGQSDGQGKTCSKCGEWKLLDEYHKSPSAKDGYRVQCMVCVEGHTEKLCRGCSVVKPLGDFRVQENGKYGRHSRCVSCQSQQQKDARISEPERMRSYAKKYKAANPDKVKAASKSSYEKNRNRRSKYRRDRYQKNKDHELAINKKWAEENPERKKEYGRISDAKRLSTPKGRLENAICAGVHRGLTKGAKASRGTFDILGYSLDRLMRHLEKRFQPGMTWDNYGKGGWDVEHKIPRSAHNYTTPDHIDFKRCWALKNLQPMWGPENYSKSDRLDKPFQPSLALAVPANDNNKATENVA